MTQTPGLRLLMQHDEPHRILMDRVALYQQQPSIFNTWHGRRLAWLDALPAPARHWVVNAYQDFYLTLPISHHGLSPEERQLKRARQYAFLYRDRMAIQLYRRLIVQVSRPKIQQDARYFLARYYRRTGQIEAALAMIQEALDHDGVGGWRPDAHVTLAEIDEALHEPTLAIQEYDRSGYATIDPLVVQRVMDLTLLIRKL